MVDGNRCWVSGKILQVKLGYIYKDTVWLECKQLILVHNLRSKINIPFPNWCPPPLHILFSSISFGWNTFASTNQLMNEKTKIPVLLSMEFNDWLVFVWENTWWKTTRHCSIQSEKICYTFLSHCYDSSIHSESIPYGILWFEGLGLRRYYEESTEFVDSATQRWHATASKICRCEAQKDMWPKRVTNSLSSRGVQIGQFTEQNMDLSFWELLFYVSQFAGIYLFRTKHKSPREIRASDRLRWETFPHPTKFIPVSSLSAFCRGTRDYHALSLDF